MNIKDNLLREQWYAIYCKSRHEQRVHERLMRKNVHTYLATYKTRVQWGTRIRKTTKNLIPGYALVHTQLDPKIYLTILETYGVVKFVGKTWPNLTSIPECQVKNMQLILNGQQEIEKVDYLQKGETVEVLTGPFAGLRGIVKNPKLRLNKIIVSIDLLRTSVAVEIKTELLRRIPASSLNIEQSIHHAKTYMI